MGRLMIVNGSPRAPRSNSKRYVELFLRYWGGETASYAVTERRHEAACRQMAACEDILLAFPLYVDGVPAILLGLLQTMERFPMEKKPRVHILINCGFLEPEQNQVAMDMIRLFCNQNGYPLGATLRIGAGEAILNTPFAFLVKRKLRKLARAISRRKTEDLTVTMPLPPRTFIRASTNYWLRYGEKYQTSREQMETMEIEGEETGRRSP